MGGGSGIQESNRDLRLWARQNGLILDTRCGPEVEQTIKLALISTFPKHLLLLLVIIDFEFDMEVPEVSG